LLASWPKLPEGERLARTRTLRLAVRLIAGGAAHEIEALLLARAEADPGLRPLARRDARRPPTITMRRVLSTFAAVMPESA
jgi:hypothetical protein